MLRQISASELAQHASAASCWVALHGKVYDLTSFLGAHPGGAALLLDVAGRDGTAAFSAAHGARGTDLLSEYLPESSVVGALNEKAPAKLPDEPATRKQTDERPPLGAIINVDDMESAAQGALAPHAWDYYRSGAETETTLRENRDAFQRILLRPRVLRAMRDVNSDCCVLGHRFRAPLYISASALAGMAHPDAECLLMRAAGGMGLPYMVPTLSSKPLREIAAARAPGQLPWMSHLAAHFLHFAYEYGVLPVSPQRTLLCLT
jgi:L-lactate dehydrogenase (cytochrome)